MANSIFAHVRINTSVYEMFEMRPRHSRVTKDIVIKNDPGAEITLVAPRLYDWALSQGLLRNIVTSSRDASVSFTAGTSAAVDTKAEMEVYLPGYCLPVWLQVIRMPGMVDSLNEILLGLDNTDELGMVMDRRPQVRHTLYHTLPLRETPVISSHIPASTLSRQCAGGSRVDHNWAGGATLGCGMPSPLAPTGTAPSGPPSTVPPAEARTMSNDGPSKFVDIEIGDQHYSIPVVEASLAAALPASSFVDVDDEAPFDLSKAFEGHRISGDDEDAVLHELDAPTVQTLEALCEMGEDALNKGSRATQRFVDNLPKEIWEWEANPTAVAPEVRVDSTSAGKATPTKAGDGASFAFQVNPDNTVEPVDVNEKPKGDRAGHFLKKFTRDEIEEHMIAQCKEQGVEVRREWMPEGLIDEIFARSQPSGKHLPTISGHWYYLRLKEDWTPHKAKHRPVPRQLVGRLQTILHSMEEMGIIKRCDDAEIVCPITLVLKKNAEGQTTIDRLCVDARPLNARLQKPGGSEQIPLMDMLYQLAEGAYLYTALDAVKSFWQTALFPSHRRYAGFSPGDGSVWCFTRMFFGASTASSVQHTLICEIVGEDLFGARAGRLRNGDTADEGCCVFVDDVLCYTRRRDGETHEEAVKRHLRLVLRIMKRMSERNLCVSVEKSHYCLQSVTYLGFVLGRLGLSIDKQKQSAIVNAPHPRTAKDLHTLIGASVWLSRVLACNLSNLVAPLRKFLLMRPHNKSYVYPYDPDDPMVIRTVKALKERIANAVTLYTPRWDEPMHVFCDAAPSRGCGMMLGQWRDTADLHHGEELAHQDNSEQKLPENTIPPAPLDENGKPRQGAFVPLYFASKSLDPEKHGKWDTAEAECYAIVLAFRKFAPWLLGSKVIVHSDHSNLQWLRQHSQQYGKLSRWLSFLSLFDMTFEFNRGLSMGIADYLSRSPVADPSMPDDGEAEKEKVLTNEKGHVILESVEAHGTFASLYGQGDECDLVHRLGTFGSRVRVDAAAASATSEPAIALGDRLSLFSVCSGIGSGQMAVEHEGLKIDTIGVCEVDPERIAIFSKAFPNVPVYGDIGVVLEAVLCGDLIISPDILELTVPCQARSQARVLADWSDTVHPHARLWDLQIKLVEAIMPPSIIIENVPPWTNSEGVSTQGQFDKLQSKIEELGYSFESSVLTASNFDDATQRRRYFAIATRKPLPPVPLPEGDPTTFKGWWHLLEDHGRMERRYRCRYEDGKSEFTQLKMRANQHDRQRAKQWGRITPRTAKEKELYDGQNTDNPKGFRIYTPDNAHCVITSYGNPSKVGPGRQTGFIFDRVGIRTLTPREAARVHSFPVFMQVLLGTLREDTAMRFVGDSVAIKTYGAVFRKLAKSLHSNVAARLAIHKENEQIAAVRVAEHTRQLEQSRLNSVWERDNANLPHVQAAKKASKAKGATKATTDKEEEDPWYEEENRPPLSQSVPELITHMYPDDATLDVAQQADPNLNAIREQLLLLDDNPLTASSNPVVKALHDGISRSRLRELEHYHLHEYKDKAFILMKLRVPRHFYGHDGEAEDDKEEGLSWKVIPSGLRDQICYLHHYSAMAGHASPSQMWQDIRTAGFWFAGGEKRCKRVYNSCQQCFRSKRHRQSLHGLHTSRRFKMPGDCVSWDCQEFGNAGPSHKGNRLCLVFLDEFDGWVDLVPIPNKTAEVVADALVEYIMNYGCPHLMWSGQDSELHNHVIKLVCARLKIKQMFTTSRNSNSMARQERVHRVVNELLRILVDKTTKNWDDFTPVVEWRLRNLPNKVTGYSPFQLRHGRVPRFPGISKSTDTDPSAKFPRAKAYLKQLNCTLQDMWSISDMLLCEAQANEWARANADRKDTKYKVGGFVMVHAPIRTKGAITRLTQNWVGPFRVMSDDLHKQYTLRHIDNGRVVQQTVSNLCRAPDEMHEGEYQERYNATQNAATPAAVDVSVNDMILVRTNRGVFPAEVWCCLADGTLHIHWFNGLKGKFSAGGAIYPSWLDDTGVKLKEVFTHSPSPAQEEAPVWTIIPISDVVGAPWTVEEKAGKTYLPAPAKAALQAWLAVPSKKHR